MESTKSRWKPVEISGNRWKHMPSLWKPAEVNESRRGGQGKSVEVDMGVDGSRWKKIWK